MSDAPGSKGDRRHERYAVDWRVSLNCKDWRMASKVAAANASRGGVFLVTQRPPPVGERVQLTISLPDGTKLTVSGTVVHVVTAEQAMNTGRGPGIGVKIDEQHEGDILLLESMAQAQADPTRPPKGPPPKAVAAVPAPSPAPVPGARRSDPRSEDAGPRRIVDVVGAPPPARAKPRETAPAPAPAKSAPAPAKSAPAAARPAPAKPAPQPTDDQIDLDLLDLGAEPPPPPAAPTAPAGAAPSIDIELDAVSPGASAGAGDLELGDLADELDPPSVPPVPAPAEVVRAASQPGENNVLARLKPSRWLLPKGRVCPAVGIDFGTSYSSVSVAIDDLVYLVPDADGRVLHPSMVSYPEKAAPVIGWSARERMPFDPRHTVASVKRLLGQPYSDPTIAGYLQSLPYKTSAGPGDQILVHIDRDTYAVPQIAGAVIGHVRDLAEKALGVPIKQVALSCPVTFAESQKIALRRAAQLAGLEVVALVMEPVAGALAYGIGQEKNELVAVYDFGGGTFDFSLLDVAGDHVRVVATEGDAWLGGDDFDLALAAAVADAFWRATKVELRQRAVEWQRLVLGCEQVKRDLSVDEVATLAIEHLIEAPKRVDLKQRVERGVLERLCAPLIDQSLEVCAVALDRAGLEPTDVTQLVVTGGVSRMPFVRDALSRYFQREVTQLVNPDEAIALGAGLKAAQAVGHLVHGVARRGG